MSKVLCPNCKSEKFDVYDNEYSMNSEYYFAYCCCETCGTQFIVKYEIFEIRED